LRREGRVHEAEDLGDPEWLAGPHRRGDARHVHLGRDGEAGPQVALPLARSGCVNGQDDRLESRVDRLGDEGVGDGAVAEAVELKPAVPARRRRGHLRRPRGGDRRQRHDRPGGSRRARHPGLAVVVRECLKGDRGDENRHRDLGAEHRCRGGRLADVDQYPVPQPPAPVRLDVLA
jgi:hypothetical protein